jgi:hypothetical protein
VSRAEQKPEDRKVNRWSHQWRDPGGYAEPEREIEDVAEAEQEMRPTTTPMITVTA